MASWHAKGVVKPSALRRVKPPPREGLYGRGVDTAPYTADDCNFALVFEDGSHLPVDGELLASTCTLVRTQLADFPDTRTLLVGDGDARGAEAVLKFVYHKVALWLPAVDINDINPDAVRSVLAVARFLDCKSVFDVTAAYVESQRWNFQRLFVPTYLELASALSLMPGSTDFQIKIVDNLLWDFHGNTMYHFAEVGGRWVRSPAAPFFIANQMSRPRECIADWTSLYIKNMSRDESAWQPVGDRGLECCFFAGDHLRFRFNRPGCERYVFVTVACPDGVRPPSYHRLLLFRHGVDDDDYLKRQETDKFFLPKPRSRKFFLVQAYM